MHLVKPFTIVIIAVLLYVLIKHRTASQEKQAGVPAPAQNRPAKTGSWIPWIGNIHTVDVAPPNIQPKPELVSTNEPIPLNTDFLVGVPKYAPPVSSANLGTPVVAEHIQPVILRDTSTPYGVRAGVLEPGITTHFCSCFCIEPEIGLHSASGNIA